jgi:para-nitrobenzyl esterase
MARLVSTAVAAACFLAALSVAAIAPKHAHESGLPGDTNPVVQTANGPIFGYTSQFGTYSFQGIPYAEPPVGVNRFQPTKPLMSNWTAARNATTFSPGCTAKCSGKFKTLMCPLTTDEDCLYLNVFTPTLNTTAMLPVIVFIHGGMFTWGAGGIPLYDGSRWAHDENIILVTINYRLNIFGALATTTLGGNYNILDQREALKWVQANIANFGGNPYLVTVSGQSAGATSTGIHLTSPGSYPYFQRAAIISNPYGLIPPSKEMAQDLGAVVLLKLGCPSGTGELACLQNKSADELFKMSEHTDFLPTPNEVLSLFMQWSPNIDGDVIPMQPIEAMDTGAFNPVPLYIGTVANESIPFIFGVDFPTPTWLMDVALDYIFGADKGAAIQNLYGPVPADQQNDTRPFFSEIVTDYAFYCPTRHVAMQASKFNGNQTYVYFFDEHPSWAKWYANGNANDPCVKWICHAFDLPTIFFTEYELPPSWPRPTAEEQQLSLFVQKAWAMFARDATVQPSWPRFDSENRVAYNLSVPIPTTPLRDYRSQYCDYFDSIGYNRH